MDKDRQRDVGFTIAELLVTITIIALLSALLLPTLRNAREKGREISCLSNLKQIGVAVELYTQDYEGWAPTCTDPNGVVYVTLNRYLNNPNVFWCPSSGVNRQWNGQSVPISTKGVSYGFNYFGTGGNSGFCSTIWSYRKLGEIATPEQLIVAADSVPDFAYEYAIGYVPPLLIWGPGNIHYGGSNVLFADGHVSWNSQDYLRSTSAIHNWNRDNSDNDY